LTRAAWLIAASWLVQITCGHQTRTLGPDPGRAEMEPDATPIRTAAPAATDPYLVRAACGCARV
jgi:hypothetical protein